jgi:asparagine synthase (glutamine-hydrolysing)
MAERVGAEHHEVLLEERDLLAFLPRMIALQDEPIGDPVCVPLYYVSKLARDHGVIVCQVGEGSDELFWGYPSWRRMLRLQHGLSKVRPKSLCRVPQWMSGLAFGPTSIVPEVFRRAAAGTPVFWSGAEAFSELQKRKLLSERMRRSFRHTTSWDAVRPLYDRFLESAWEKTPLQWMSYLDLNQRIPELLLMRVDKMSMGVSLEARVPFLDHRFVEFAMGIPEGLKTRNNTLKYILKKSVRGVIPDELIDRPKQGFGVPVYEWVASGLGQVAERELTSFASRTDFLDREAVSAVVRSARARAGKSVLGTIGRTRASEQLWYLLNLALWWRHYIAREPIDLPVDATHAVSAA